MNKVESRNGMMDAIKWGIVGLIIMVGVGGNYYFADTPTLMRGMAVCAVIVFAMGISLTTVKGRAFWKFLQDAKIELQKVVWPTRQETVHATLVVVGVVLLMGIFLWVLDSLLLKLMSLFTQ
jgi:preprotein translocase subunit SecE